MAAPDNILAAMEHIEAAMQLLSVEMGSNAASSCLMQFCRNASGKPLEAVRQEATPAATAQHTSNPVEGTQPSKPKRRNKRSLPKRAERAESHGRWLRQQLASQDGGADNIDASKDGTAQGSIDRSTELASPQDVSKTIKIVPLEVPPGDNVGNSPTNKRPSDTAPMRSPRTTPTRTPSVEKKSRTAPHQTHHQTLFRSTSGSSTSKMISPPPQVALMAQDFATKEIAASQWAYLAHPELANTHTRCVHMLSVELIKRGVSEWKQMCHDIGPHILREQCEADGVPVVQY